MGFKRAAAAVIAFSFDLQLNSPFADLAGIQVAMKQVFQLFIEACFSAGYTVDQLEVMVEQALFPYPTDSRGMN